MTTPPANQGMTSNQMNSGYSQQSMFCQPQTLSIPGMPYASPLWEMDRQNNIAQLGYSQNYINQNAMNSCYQPTAYSMSNTYSQPSSYANTCTQYPQQYGYSQAAQNNQCAQTYPQYGYSQPANYYTNTGTQYPQQCGCSQSAQNYQYPQSYAQNTQQCAQTPYDLITQQSALTDQQIAYNQGWLDMYRQSQANNNGYGQTAASLMNGQNGNSGYSYGYNGNNNIYSINLNDDKYNGLKRFR